MRFNALSSALVILLGTVLTHGEPAIRSGDHIAIVGNTFADQLRIHGYLETLLLQHSDVSIRNLGWGGDMLAARDRPTNFPSEDSTLTDHRTDVINACFGMGESFAGEDGLEKFHKDLEAFFTAHQGKSYNGKSPVRLVVVSPIACEDLGKLTSNVQQRNRDLKAYTEVMRETSSKAGVLFVDLFEPTRYYMEEPSGPKLTTNGIHLNAYGYWAVSRIFYDRLVAEANAPWRVEIDAASGKGAGRGVKVSGRGNEARRSAAIALAGLDKGTHLEALDQLSREGDVPTGYFAIVGLARADLNRAINSAARLFTEDPGSADPVPTIQAILQQRKGSAMLTNALQKVELHPAVKARISEFHRTSGQLPESLAKLFSPTIEEGGSLSAKLLAEDPAALTSDVDKLGDAARGEMIYRRKAIACSSCHAIGPAGPEIGPNLVAVGTAATTSYMVESILQPNAAIAEHYENRLFTLTDGSIRMGVISFKSDKEVVIRDSAQAGKEVRISAADIQKEQTLPSLMPAGLADQLQSRSEFLDLAKFLSVLGKPGPFANNESPVLRKWRILSDPGEVSVGVPAYSKVSGELPVEDFTPGGKVLARSYIEVHTAGTIKLVLNDLEGVTLSLDGQAINNLTDPIPLDSGRHSLTFTIDRPKRGDKGLRVGIKPADEQVKFQPEGGL